MKRLLRSAAVISATALTVTTFASAASAAYDPKPAVVSGNWLASQLTDGVIHNDQYDFDDIGLSADVLLGLVGAGRNEADIVAIAAAIEPRAESEWYSSTFGGVTTVYAGSLAKAAVVADTAGLDPASFGGVDLVAALEARVATSAPITGRIEDENNDFGDSNVIGQAFASQALYTAGSSQSVAVTDFLLEQQCAEGYFRVSFTDKAATDQSCDGGTDNSDTDATALVLLALEDQAPDPDVANALVAGASWLIDQQAADGSFTSGDPLTPEKNTNSTGLAGWALGELGHPTEATAAATWVRKNMAADASPCTTEVTSERGALAYNGPALKTGRSDGITDLTSDQWRRATAQALPVLQWAPAADDDDALTGPTRFVRAKSTQTLRISGLAPSERGCVYGAGDTKVVRGTGAKLSAEVTLPGGTADRVFGVASLDGTERTTLRALGSLEVPFGLGDRTVAKGAKQTVRVSGLEAGEAVTILWRGDVVATGVAGPGGRFSDTFKVGRTSGSGKVRVNGQFADLRNNTKTFTVR